MKILFLFDGLHRGGRERRFVQIIKGLNEKGYTDLYMISSLDSITYEEIYNYQINISIIKRPCKSWCLGKNQKLKKQADFHQFYQKSLQR